MATNQTYENLEDTFLTGLKGVLKISNFRSKKTKISLLVAALLSVVTPLVLVALDYPLYDFIIKCTELIVNSLPDILGFTISGYAIIIGFVQGNMLNKITEKKSDSPYSLYQEISATIAANVIIQTICLLIAFGFSLIAYMDSKSDYEIKNENISCTINFCGSVLILFSLVIASIMSVKIVLNVFDFSQLNHYFINKDKITEELKKNKKPQPRKSKTNGGPK